MQGYCGGTMMLFDYKKFPNVQQESSFRFNGEDYLYFPEEKVEFYTLNYSKDFKIKSFQQFMYLMKVLVYLNPNMVWDYFLLMGLWLNNRKNGKTLWSYNKVRVEKELRRIWIDAEKPYVNYYRRVVFNPSRQMSVKYKLELVGRLCGGHNRKVNESILYDVIEHYMALNVVIKVKDLALRLNVTRQTISNHLSDDLRGIIKDHNESYYNRKDSGKLTIW